MTLDETDARTQNRKNQQNRRDRVANELPVVETIQTQRVTRTNFAVKRAAVVFVLVAIAIVGLLFGGDVENQRQIARLIADVATGTSSPAWMSDGNASAYRDDSNTINVTSLNSTSTVAYALWMENL